MLLRLLILCFVSSCTLIGPKYKKPEVVKTPDQFKEGKVEWKKSEPNADIDRGEWWKIYNDSVLNNLENKLNKHNQNIISAEHSYKASLALVEQARSSFMPVVSANADTTKQRQQQNTANGGTSSKIKKSHSLGINSSWEMDLWGNLTYSLKSNVASAQSAKANWSNVKLSMQTSLAQYYFELKSAIKDQKALNSMVLSNEKLLEYYQNRYKFGIANQIDVQNAQNNYQTAQTNALNNKTVVVQYQHAIAVLIGESPSSFILNVKEDEGKPVTIPLIMPSQLLERRPDIAQSEKLVAQANAQIGIAETSFFPVTTLNANVGLEGSGLGKLLSMPTLTWSVGPQLALALFDGGYNIAQTKYAKENYQATVASYRQTVLNAFSEVEDQLASLQSLEEQTKLQKMNLINAKNMLQFTYNQYNAGIVDHSSLLNAQITFDNAEKNYSDTLSLRRTAEIGLIKALGGGWKE